MACAWDTLWNYSLKGKLLAPYMYLMTKKYIKKSRNVIYVTSQFLQQRYPTNGNYIGCSDAIIKNQDDFNINKRIDKIANLHKENKIVLGTIGAIDVKYKGQKYIIKALAKLKKEGITNYEYHLVGGGKSDYLIKLSKKYKVSDLIKIIGSVPHEKIFDWLDDIDIYVQPSLTEGLPRSVIEAMSRACPAIGTNVGGIPELLDKDYLFSKKSVKEICKILKTFNVEKMKNQSIINYEKSKLFTEDYLNNKRSKFLKDIITRKQF